MVGEPQGHGPTVLRAIGGGQAAAVGRPRVSRTTGRSPPSSSTSLDGPGRSPGRLTVAGRRSRGRCAAAPGWTRRGAGALRPPGRRSAPLPSGDQPLQRGEPAGHALVDGVDVGEPGRRRRRGGRSRRGRRRQEHHGRAASGRIAARRDEQLEPTLLGGSVAVDDDRRRGHRSAVDGGLDQLGGRGGVGVAARPVAHVEVVGTDAARRRVAAVVERERVPAVVHGHDRPVLVEHRHFDVEERLGQRAARPGPLDHRASRRREPWAGPSSLPGERYSSGALARHRLVHAEWAGTSCDRRRGRAPPPLRRSSWSSTRRRRALGRPGGAGRPLP